VVISGDRDTSYVHWANPMASSNLRPPAPSKSALEDVCTRVSKALSGLRQIPEAVVPMQQG
jgi:hypothetical protein